MTRRIDLERFVTLLGMTVVLGGTAGLYKYFDTAYRDYHSYIWQQQVALYTEAASAAATVATGAEGEERKRAAVQFWRLYRGLLILVEDATVANAMIAFGECLGAAVACGDAEYRERALLLPYAARQSIEENWDTGVLQWTDLSPRLLAGCPAEGCTDPKEAGCR